MERRILFFTCAAHALTHVYMVTYSAVLPHMNRDLDADVYSYVTISVMLFGAGSFPAGWLGEKFGEKKLLVAFFFLSAAGGTAIGLAHGTFGLALGMTLLGLGTSIFHPVGNTIIANGIRSPGRAMGTNGMWGSFGEALGPLLAGGIAWLFGSWRGSYLALTIPSLAIGLLLAWTPLEIARAGEAPGAAFGEAPDRGSTARRFHVIFWLLCAMMFGGFQFWIVKTALPEFVGANTSSALLPGFLQDPMLRGAALTSLMYLIGGFGQIAAGRLVHNREGRGLYAVVFLASIPLILLTGMLRDLPLLAAGCIMTFLMFAAQPIENVLLARFAAPNWKGRLFGLKFTLAFGVGGLGVKLCGWVRERQGLSATLTWAAIFTSAALACAFLALAARRSPRSPVRAATPAAPAQAASKPFTG